MLAAFSHRPRAMDFPLAVAQALQHVGAVQVVVCQTRRHVLLQTPGQGLMPVSAQGSDRRGACKVLLDVRANLFAQVASGQSPPHQDIDEMAHLQRQGFQVHRHRRHDLMVLRCRLNESYLQKPPPQVVEPSLRQVGLQCHLLQQEARGPRWHGNVKCQRRQRGLAP